MGADRMMQKPWLVLPYVTWFSKMVNHSCCGPKHTKYQLALIFVVLKFLKISVCIKSAKKKSLRFICKRVHLESNRLRVMNGFFTYPNSQRVFELCTGWREFFVWVRLPWALPDVWYPGFYQLNATSASCYHDGNKNMKTCPPPTPQMSP